MKSSDTNRMMVYVLCCLSLWSTAVIASVEEDKANEIMMVWPKDEASQDKEGYGNPKTRSW